MVKEQKVGAKGFILVHSLAAQRPMWLRSKDIVLVAAKYHAVGGMIATTRQYAEIVLRNGDKGECIEPVATVMNRIRKSEG